MKRWVCLTVLLGQLAAAQVVTPFAIRYQTNEKGAITLVANTLMCAATTTGTQGCDTRVMNNPRANDNSYSMIFVNADPTAPTWPRGRGGSSSATLNLPQGSQVLFAGLYWGARAGQNATGHNQIYIKPPGSSAYQTLNGTLLGTIPNEGTPTTRPYAAFADVTQLVQASGSGTYWVGGILAATGNDGLGFYAGWSLVVVYRDPNQPLRNLVVYDGLASIYQNSVTITPSGFLAPPYGSVNARVGAVAFEGDGGITGDQLLLNGTALSDSQNPSTNFFNSSVSLLGTRFTAKNPDYINQMGLDADIVDATGRIPNGATTATLTFTSSQDAYFPTALTFQIDLYLPDLVTTFSKTGQDLNGGDVLVGDVLEYAISFTNTGLDGATNVVLTDPIPPGTQYVPDSLRVVSNAIGAPTGSFTDSPGDDIAEYAPSCPEHGGSPCVRFRLGTGANASQGGLIPPGQGAEVRFRVQILPSAAGQTVTNTARIRYNAQTLGTAYEKTAETSVAVTVVTEGYNLQGSLYHDQEPNGLKDPSENWSTGTTVYVNLVQGNTVVQSTRVDPGSGGFAFQGVPPGNYSLVVATSPTATQPQAPPGWLFINPGDGRRQITVAGHLQGLDFGLFHGGMVQGQVFSDDGLAGGNANNALQDGGERGVGNVAVTATDGTQTRTALTDGSGFYRIYIPAYWGGVTLSHPLRPATGWNEGAQATQVANWNEATSPSSPGATLGLGPASSLAGYTWVRNFGVVRDSRFHPDASGQTSSPGVYTFGHWYRPGTLGTVTLAPRSPSPRYTYQVRVDGNCDGVYGPGEDWTPFPYTFPVDGTWPREADGSLRACTLEVRALVPAGEPIGATDIALLEARLTWQGNPVVQEIRTLTDTLQITGSEVRLDKQVRNVSQNTPFATAGQGKPGEVLEYCIAYRNLGTGPVGNFTLSDPVPFFTDPLTSVADYGGMAIRWTHGASTQYLTASPGDDAGQIAGGLVKVEVGTVGPGEKGEVCYRVRVR